MNRRKQDREDRMLGVNGQSPTLRDRWQAFYRLWRIAQRKTDDWHEQAVKECFWTLFPKTRLTKLLSGSKSDGLVDRSHIPMFLRRRLLDDARRRRLYAGQYELLEHDKAVSVAIANQHGIEMTPEQVAEIRYEICRKIREAANRDGKTLPKSDAALLDLLRKSAKGGA